MTIDTFFLSQGIFIIFFWLGLEGVMMFQKKLPKFWKKHLKKRKKYFTGLALFFLFLGWASVEETFSGTTQTVLFSIGTILFWGLFLWSMKIIGTDYFRIKRAIERREKKENKK